MASILMGALTGFTVILCGILCFWAGVLSVQKYESAQKASPVPTDEQKRVAEGFTNLLNYANRHSK